ncbi:MAG: hypothetical protein AB4063_13600 [Crocosphaera sp.]
MFLSLTTAKPKTHEETISMSYPDYIWWIIPEKLGGVSCPPLED